MIKKEREREERKGKRKSCCENTKKSSSAYFSRPVACEDTWLLLISDWYLDLEVALKQKT